MTQTTPLNMYQRVARYVAQRPGADLTPRQSRRANKKLNQADRREREARDVV